MSRGQVAIILGSIPAAVFNASVVPDPWKIAWSFTSAVALIALAFWIDEK